MRVNRNPNPSPSPYPNPNQVRRFAEAAAEEESEHSSEELTARLKEVMAQGGTAKMRQMRARGRDSGGMY